MNTFTYELDGQTYTVTPAPKEDIERFLGKKISEEEYSKIVIERSIPKDAQNIKI